MASSVSVSHVTKSYDKKKAVLDDLDFKAEPGEFVVLIGPSGCGKSTVLRVIAGLEGVTNGTIKIGDRDVTNLEPKDRNIAMVFQDYALYPHKSVYENIAFGLRMRKLDEKTIDGRVQEAAKKLNLTSYLERKPSALSGGQRQRVAIGRAIVRKPEVFLFDEPLSNLDAKLRGTMRLSIAKLHKELKTTIVYVTHDQIEAMTLADRIVVLHEGKIQQMGAPLDLYYYPANVFVATFIGSPPMNLVKGRLEDRGGLQFVSENGLEFKIPQKVIGDLDLSKKTSDEVIWGIRAENFIDGRGKDQHFSCEAEVLVSEPLGASTSVYCKVKGHELHLQFPEPFRPMPGDKISLSWWADHVYLFDGKTGKTLVKKNDG